MKNKLLFICFILLVFVLTGCEKPEEYTDDIWTVTFLNHNGEFLGYSKVNDGGTVVYSGKTPEKDKTEASIYEFSGWDKSVEKIRKDDVFTAQFIEKPREYKVKFQNYDGTVLDDQITTYGGSVTYHGITPTHETDEVGTYTFDGWIGSLDNIKSDTTLIAKYTVEKNVFEWTFYDYDHTTVLAKVEVKYGEKPIYPYENPTRRSNPQYDYTFSKWENECKEAKNNGSSYAYYESKIKSYRVVFKNYDGTILQSSYVNYGITPSYNGNIPKKNSTAVLDFTFNNWNKSISFVTTDVEYTATFIETARKYNVKFNNYDGTLLYQVDVEYNKSAEYVGNTPTKPSDGKSNYTFDKWNIDFSKITSDTVVQAIYTASDNIDYLTFSISADQKYYSVFLKNSISLRYTEYYIPSEYNNKPVKEIGSLSNQYVKNVYFGENIEIIREKAFINCYNLSEINLGNNIKSIGIDAFSGCKKLVNATVNANVQAIPTEMFYNCSALKNITIGETINTIGTNAFYGCTSLSSIKIPSNITTICQYAFANTGLTEIEIPENVINIESKALSYCSVLQKVIFNANVETFPGELFNYSPCINEIIIGPNVHVLGLYSFYQCTALKTITIPSNVTTISGKAFYYSGINSISIPETVTQIDNYAFSNCAYLGTANIDANVDSISLYCFENCTSLKNVNIGKHITKICSYAFYKCNILNELVLPSNITQICTNAFYYSGINTITIPNTVTVMETGAFSDAKILRSIIINADIEYIPVECFTNCVNLKYVEINSEIKSIYTMAFNNCTSLNNISIPDSVETISQHAFNGCTVLNKIVIGSGIKTISQYAFNSIKNLNIFIKLPNDEGISINKYCKEDSAQIYYYSETENSGYWHYVNEEPVLW